MTLGTNLALRVAAIILAGFVVLQFVVFNTMTPPGTEVAQPRTYNLPSPEQFAAIVETLDAASPQRRALLVQTFDASLYSVSIEPKIPILPPTNGREIAAIEASYRAALGGRAITFWARPSVFGHTSSTMAWTGRFFAPATLAVSLRSGSALVLASRPPAIMRSFLRKRAGIGALIGIMLLLALAWAVRQSTRPITVLARNIRAFSQRLDAPDLPVTGARELRELTLAYNDMKSRIAGLMSERTRILAGIAHDMRTYLTRLRLRVEFLDDADQRERATRDLAEMSLLLDDTLLFAQPSTASPVLDRVDLATELSDMVALRQELGDAVELAGAVGSLPVRANRLALRRVLSNLIDNGLRHGNRVVLRGEGCNGNMARVVVTDDGPGVSPELLGRLGQAFDRLDPSRNRSSGGAGLGLAIVRALMDQQQGEVSFRNAPAGGLEATLIFRAVGAD